jgi:hypothetical protein
VWEWGGGKGRGEVIEFVSEGDAEVAPFAWKASGKISINTVGKKPRNTVTIVSVSQRSVDFTWSTILLPNSFLGR